MTTRSPADYVRTLLRLQREEHTGVLRVRSEASETRLLFHRGKAVSAEGGDVGDSLGRLLLETDVIDEDTYTKAIDALPEDDTSDLRLGMALIQAGKLGGDALSDAFALQVKRKIERPLAFRALTMAFNPLEELPKGTQKYPCRIEPCVLSGTRRHFGARGADHYIGGLTNKYLALREAPILVAERFEMNTHEARFLANLTGTIQTKRLLRSGATSSFNPAIVVAALVLTADLTASAERAGDAPDSAPQSVRRPPRMGTRSSSPGQDRAPDSSPSILPSQGSRSERSPASEPPQSWRSSHISSMPPPGEISLPEARISQMEIEAVDLPGPSSQRSPSSVRPPQASPAQADKAFQRGLRHMRAEQWSKASDEFGTAAAARLDSAEYQLYSVWATYKVCTLEDERSVLRLELADCARRLAKSNRSHGFPPYVLGHIALAAEEDEKALKLFGMAAKLDKRNRDAERHVRLLTSRLEGKKKKKKSGGLL